MTSIQSYRGYAVKASAHRLPDRTFSANVSVDRSNQHFPESQYTFYSIGYFSKEGEAISYARRWARDWIDTRG
ncbi:transcriptional regulator [Caballeronia pedi]|uniref:Transcriptional regulator n=1 Tax=Caballeronia pedi TaxID=1777141 RepID=A0A158CBZ8_9BURK|nr:hypothetical protein [Caballeronia pedi]SAK79888.1 transcriptional regulator [Caballeronia pedi]